MLMSNSALIKASNINSAQLIAFFSILSPSHCDLHQNDWTKWTMEASRLTLYCVKREFMYPQNRGTSPSPNLTLYSELCGFFVFFRHTTVVNLVPVCHTVESNDTMSAHLHFYLSVFIAF